MPHTNRQVHSVLEAVLAEHEGAGGGGIRGVVVVSHGILLQALLQAVRHVAGDLPVAAGPFVPMHANAAYSVLELARSDQLRHPWTLRVLV
jgi:broad specificity phosphatase PhoE